MIKQIDIIDKDKLELELDVIDKLNEVITWCNRAEKIFLNDIDELRRHNAFLRSVKNVTDL